MAEVAARLRCPRCGSGRLLLHPYQSVCVADLGPRADVTEREATVRRMAEARRTAPLPSSDLNPRDIDREGG